MLFPCAVFFMIAIAKLQGLSNYAYISINTSSCSDNNTDTEL